MTTTVVNRKVENFDVYIGRGSKWGNPFSHKEGTKAEFVVASREEAVAEYRKWLVNQPHLMNSLHELKDKRLGCYCKPALCHGDVLAEIVNKTVSDCGCQFIDGTVVHMCYTHGTEMDMYSVKHMAVSFTGHRPHWDKNRDKIGTGYSITNDMVKRYSEMLRAELIKLIDSGYHYFISGGAIGFDQIAFWTVNKLKKDYPDIRNIVAVPYKDQPNVWKGDEIVAWYQQMIKRADSVIYVDELTDYARTNVSAGKYHVAKLNIRNEFMVDYSSLVVALWDGSSGGTGNCVKYAKEQNKQIVVLKPLKS